MAAADLYICKFVYLYICIIGQHEATTSVQCSGDNTGNGKRDISRWGRILVVGEVS